MCDDRIECCPGRAQPAKFADKIARLAHDNAKRANAGLVQRLLNCRGKGSIIIAFANDDQHVGARHLTSDEVRQIAAGLGVGRMLRI